jgi:hypothetical protein
MFDNTTRKPLSVVDAGLLRLGGYLAIGLNVLTMAIALYVLVARGSFRQSPYFAAMPWGVVGCLALGRAGVARAVTVPLGIAFGLVSIVIFLRYCF